MNSTSDFTIDPARSQKEPQAVQIVTLSSNTNTSEVSQSNSEFDSTCERYPPGYFSKLISRGGKLCLQ